MEIFDAITRKHVLSALKKIKENGIPNKKAQSLRYDLIHKKVRFPPKLVLSIAHKIATGSRSDLDRESFDGGRPTNSKLEELGFRIVRKLKHRAKSADDKMKELLEKAEKSGEKKPKLKAEWTETYLRSSKIAELTKRLSKGKCDLCKKLGPFIFKKTRHLECHHIGHLAQGGPDVLENTVALCPNCHRKMHILDKPSDRKKLKKKAKSKLRQYQS